MYTSRNAKVKSSCLPNLNELYKVSVYIRVTHRSVYPSDAAPSAGPLTEKKYSAPMEDLGGNVVIEGYDVGKF
jgi:hypothetical protein